MLKKMVENIIVIGSIALILWMGVSWIEICTKNLSENPQYNENNFWVNAIEFTEERGWAE